MTSGSIIAGIIVGGVFMIVMTICATMLVMDLIKRRDDEK